MNQNTISLLPSPPTILEIKPDNFQPNLCHWCVDPCIGNYVISRRVCAFGVINHYACQLCADGWRDIANLDDRLTV